MRPDGIIRPGSPEHVTVREVAVLAGRDPADFRGYVLLLVPGDRNAAVEAVEVLTDAPSPAALITVLASVAASVGNKLQLQGESGWSQ